VLAGKDVILIGRASHRSEMMFIITSGSCFRWRLARADRRRKERDVLSFGSPRPFTAESLLKKADRPIEPKPQIPI
jgi:hypothetical protein